MSVRMLALRGIATRSLFRNSVNAATLAPRVFQAQGSAVRSHHFSTSIIKREQQQDPTQAKLGQVEPKLSLTFTCAVTDCGHRSTHEFSRRSYEKGIVIVQCPSCKNRHLIADHLSWFTETPSDPKNIEEIIASKGGKVQRGINYVDGQGYETMEIYKDDK